MFAMAESAFLDDGSHLDHKIISADHIRRNEICWPVPGRCLTGYALVVRA